MLLTKFRVKVCHDSTMGTQSAANGIAKQTLVCRYACVQFGREEGRGTLCKRSLHVAAVIIIAVSMATHLQHANENSNELSATRAALRATLAGGQ